jgi:hypothetical protein
MTLVAWAVKHGVSHAALTELYDMWGIGESHESTSAKPKSEAAVQNAVRQEWSELGGRGWRNNNGAYDAKHPPSPGTRWGLCNDSAAMNKKVKSSDLIGPLPRLITPEMVGTTIAQFAARECKPEGWVYSGTEREVAQLRFGQIVTMLGGDFKFVTGPGSFD